MPAKALGAIGMMSSVTTLLPALSLIFVIQKTSASVPGFTGMMVHVTWRPVAEWTTLLGVRLKRIVEE